MIENQHIEFKSQWHDDCLKEICAFANAQGGNLYIGMDDDGNIIGIEDVKKLVEVIPVKMKNMLGVTGEVNVLQENDKQYIQVVVPKMDSLVTLRGKTFVRSGSVSMELSGSMLQNYLISSMNLTWDQLPEPRATMDDLDEESVELYKKMAEKGGRIPQVLELNMEELLHKLELIHPEGQLTRAAILLFGKNPYRFYPSNIKIGAFGESAADIKFDDLVETNIVRAIIDVPEILSKKYLVAPIHFEGFYRREVLEYPVEALREALLNAMIHKNYNTWSDIYIRVYADHIMFSNSGGLHHELTVEDLKRNHRSYPRNKLLAHAIYRTGLIEQWGSGTIKIYEECKKAGLPEPLIETSEYEFKVTLFKDRYQINLLKKVGLKERQIHAIMYLKDNGRITNKEYQELNGVSRNTASRDLGELMQKGFLKESGAKGAGSYFELKE